MRIGACCALTREAMDIGRKSVDVSAHAARRVIVEVLGKSDTSADCGELKVVLNMSCRLLTRPSDGSLKEVTGFQPNGAHVFGIGDTHGVAARCDDLDLLAPELSHH